MLRQPYLMLPLGHQVCQGSSSNHVFIWNCNVATCSSYARTGTSMLFFFLFAVFIRPRGIFELFCILNSTDKTNKHMFLLIQYQNVLFFKEGSFQMQGLIHCVQYIKGDSYLSINEITHGLRTPGEEIAFTA